MKNQLITNKLFTIRSANNTNLLIEILTFFKQHSWTVVTISQGSTDIAGSIVITIEVTVPGEKIDNCADFLRSMPYVEDVTVSFGDPIRIGWFLLLTKEINENNYRRIQEQGGATVSWSPSTIIIRKEGRLSSLEKFYNNFKDLGLLGFCHYPIPINEMGLLANFD